MIKTAVLSLAGLLCSAVILSQNPSELFFSEYVEGSSYNKYIEIFNGTGYSVDLSDYEIHVFSNGHGDLTSPSSRVILDGILLNKMVYVVGNSRADQFSSPDLLDGNLNFNGDDAVCLFKVSEDKYVDVFGAIGVDPGDSWTSGVFSTKDHSLIRKASVMEGALITENKDDFLTLGTEWEQVAIDNVSNLGMHTYGSVTDIPAVKKNGIFKVSPNPVSDILFFKTSKEVTGVKVYSFSGEEMFSQEQSGKENLDVSGLPSGFYLMAVKFADGSSRNVKFCVR